MCRELKSVYKSEGAVRKEVLPKQLYQIRKTANILMPQFVSDFIRKTDHLENIEIKLLFKLISIMFLSECAN